MTRDKYKLFKRRNKSADRDRKYYFDDHELKFTPGVGEAGTSWEKRL